MITTDPTQTLRPTEQTTRAPDQAEVRRQDAAQKMEQLFMTMLVKQMRKSVPNGLFGKGPGSSIYEGMFDRSMSEALASNPNSPLREAILMSIPAGSVKNEIDDAALDNSLDVAIDNTQGAVINDTSIVADKAENGSVASALLAERLRSEITER